jgi:hypothetical protein
MDLARQLQGHVDAGTFDVDRDLRAQVVALLRVLRDDAGRSTVDTTARYTLVGCPRCGARPGEFCTSARGWVYSFAAGFPPMFHAARRQIVDDLDPEWDRREGAER